MTEKNYNPDMHENKDVNVQKAAQKIVVPKVKVDEAKTEETKKEAIKVEAPKKDFAQVNINGAEIKTKVAMAICKFIKHKKIEDSIKYLEQVAIGKKAMPMKGEIPHRKGDMMSGRYPKNASNFFIMALKSLASNAVQHGVENPVVVEAVANFAPRPFARWGRWQRKRTHLKLIAKSKMEKKAVQKTEKKK